MYIGTVARYGTYLYFDNTVDFIADTFTPVGTVLNNVSYYFRVTVDGKETAWKLECFPNGKQKVGEVSCFHSSDSFTEGIVSQISTYGTYLPTWQDRESNPGFTVSINLVSLHGELIYALTFFFIYSIDIFFASNLFSL